MINFENTFLDGLSLSGKVSGKVSGKARPAPAKPASRSLGIAGATRAAVNASRPTPAARAKIKAKAETFPTKARLPHFKVPTLRPTATLIAKAPAVSVAIKAAQALGKPTLSPAALMAAKGVVNARTGIAAGLMKKAVATLAKKAPILPANLPFHMLQAKAAQAVAPVAHACKCQAKHVVKRLDDNLTCKGYPANTATSLLASVHDMNTALEKAALQRLATYEHNKLTSKARFEHEVLEKLAKLAGKLAPCHPARTRAHLTILRKT